MKIGCAYVLPTCTDALPSKNSEVWTLNVSTLEKVFNNVHNYIFIIYIIRSIILLLYM